MDEIQLAELYEGYNLEGDEDIIHTIKERF